MLTFSRFSGPMLTESIPVNISRYEVKSLIGRGGMGDLYLARDPNTNRLVAIKLLKEDYLEDQEFRERFSREARFLASLPVDSGRGYPRQPSLEPAGNSA